MINRHAVRDWSLAFAATAATTALYIAFLDRPAAEYFYRNLPPSAPIWINRILAPLALAVPLALLSLVAGWLWARSGRSLAPATRTPLLCCRAAVWAALAIVVLKYALGRGSPYPAFLRDGLYGFRLFDGSPLWHSFPSGTAAVSAAILAVLWKLVPRSRTASVTIVALLWISVIVANDHWLGDVTAGAYLGALIGRLNVREPELRESK